MDGDGRLFAYFFGPRSETLEELHCSDMVPDRAILRGLCGDLGIIKGEWHLVGSLPDWDRSRWPMPLMFRGDESPNGKCWLSRYDDDTLNFVEEMPASRDLEDQYPYDRLMGYGAVEIRLTKILNDPVD